jgi:hypothetical protein
MSYSTISKCVNDAAFNSRVTSCVAQEQLARDEPVAPTGPNAAEMLWAVASASDVEAAYASALAANNPDPGGDESVITDGMILSHVQGNWQSPVTVP